MSMFLLLLVKANGQSVVVPDNLKLKDSSFIFSQAPFESCHASTVVQSTGKRLIAAWFGGKNEGDTSVSIWMSTKEKKGWSKPKMIADGIQPGKKRYPCWNPVLFYNNMGTLFLFYKVGSSPATWWGEVKFSYDHGKTWSVSRKLPTGFLGPIKDKPLLLKNGDMLCPSSYEDAQTRKWTIHLERCDNTANNWAKTEIDCDKFNVIQPALLTYVNDKMQLLCRSRENVIAESWSNDGGNTWGPVKESSLPNPNSGIDAVTLKNGLQLLVYNPLRNGNNDRSVLKVALSSDGIQWKDVFTLEEHANGEYSYPAVIQSSDGVIHITYTYKREKIKYVSLIQ